MPTMPFEGTEPSESPEDISSADHSPAHARGAGGDAPSHAAAEGAPVHPLIDLSRDPNPGVPDHAARED